MDHDTYKEILGALDEWISLLSHPACGTQSWVRDLKERRASIQRDAGSLKRVLVDGNIWAGMGSLIDCAGLNYDYFLSEASAATVTATELNAAAKEVDAWKRKFNTATVRLGTALLDWCSGESSLKPGERKGIEGWVAIAISANKAKFRPLTKDQLRTLKHNLSFARAHGCSI